MIFAAHERVRAELQPSDFNLEPVDLLRACDANAYTSSRERDQRVVAYVVLRPGFQL